ncbi:hypothetical protein WA1_00635 [Scytonema hofmannii PCC 7110]|uniref:DUF1269 domain-containing protein n=1 Tax=Scytonema hofmannii PCC 7110 TaxID=128403 RepID=A0A139XG93_9CYAN|nr:hypothetical protein [Scytonema hofmannii]KYC43708.1 hypothetical protein WA1_00635 [Scytonema hofmannii PCC 7110]
MIDRAKQAVGVFPNRQTSESALNALQNSDFPMQKVSLIVKDASVDKDRQLHEDFSDSIEWRIQKGGARGAITGTALGGLSGLLVGLSMVAIPGVGPVLVGGALGTTLATTLAGGGAGALVGEMVGAFRSFGIPKDRAQEYANCVSQGKYVVLVEGNEQEIHRAESILSESGIQEWGIY